MWYFEVPHNTPLRNCISSVLFCLWRHQISTIVTRMVCRVMMDGNILVYETTPSVPYHCYGHTGRCSFMWSKVIWRLAIVTLWLSLVLVLYLGYELCSVAFTITMHDVYVRHGVVREVWSGPRSWAHSIHGGCRLLITANSCHKLRGLEITPIPTVLLMVGASKPLNSRKFCIIYRKLLLYRNILLESTIIHDVFGIL